MLQETVLAQTQFGILKWNIWFLIRYKFCKLVLTVLQCRTIRHCYHVKSSYHWYTMIITCLNLIKAHKNISFKKNMIIYLVQSFDHWYTKLIYSKITRKKFWSLIHDKYFMLYMPTSKFWLNIWNTFMRHCKRQKLKNKLEIFKKFQLKSWPCPFKQ